MGWPRTTGLFVRKKIVNLRIVWVNVEIAVKYAISLGAARPRIALALLVEHFSEGEWTLRFATELWADLDPSDEVAAQPDKRPEELITAYPHADRNPLALELVPWDYVLSENFLGHYYLAFCKGLVWGLSQPEEALEQYEKERQRAHECIPKMLQYGLEAHPIPAFDEWVDIIEEEVNTYQNEIRPLAEVPQSLLDLPQVRARLRQPGI